MAGVRPRRVAFADLGPDHTGEAHFETNAVVIDLRDPTANPIDTYIHECIHLEHPEWSEGRVEREANARTRSLSQHEAAALLKHVVRRGVVWEADE